MTLMELNVAVGCLLALGALISMYVAWWEARLDHRLYPPHAAGDSPDQDEGVERIRKTAFVSLERGRGRTEAQGKTKGTKMNKDKILGVVRHILTMGAGYLMAKGIVDEGSAQEIIAGVMALIGVLWSVADKK